MRKIILTGDRPTGRFFMSATTSAPCVKRVELQNSGKFDDIYIMIADAQALTDNADNPEKVRRNVREVALDYLAVGIDPAKSCIFIQSMVPELTELTMYYVNLVTVSRLQKIRRSKQRSSRRISKPASQPASSATQSARRATSRPSRPPMSRPAKTRSRCSSRHARSSANSMTSTAKSLSNQTSSFPQTKPPAPARHRRQSEDEQVHRQLHLPR